MNVNLIMFSDRGERKEFPVLSKGLVIGRHEDCSLRIPLAEVSRRHTQVITEGKDVRVKDLGSTNGTFVNNKRITEHRLNPGDHLVVGPVVFTVQIDGKPEHIMPPVTRDGPLSDSSIIGLTEDLGLSESDSGFVPIDDLDRLADTEVADDEDD